MPAHAFSSPRVVVVGGGVIGLAVAWELALAGVDVVLLERDDEGGVASRAAGGMLAPLGEADDPGPFLAFALDSLERYPAWVDRLEAAADMEVGLRRCGKLLVALDAATEERLRRRAAWQIEAGHRARWMEPDEVRRMEPGVTPGLRGGVHLPSDAQVDNRLLHRALTRAVLRSGAEVRTGAEVEALVQPSGVLTGVRLQGGEVVEGDRVVVAAGAWSGRLHGAPRALPIRPVRGQMVQLGPTRAPLHGLVASPEAYLIPRPTPGGFTVVVGASQEEAGYEVRTDPATLQRLRAAAIELLPALQGLPVADSWAGLRPGTPDDLPVLGPDPELPGLIYATGHFRNGILLAPATAAALSACVTGRGVGPAPGFRPERFVG